ncbi:BatD family protein [Haliovirga abyssi]|uniref:Protein BatD n=1 Tax=Haliovirga abyssi TaxID=2996794 RepID=A0AAU9DDS9_9FUSO|nr:BatD family protein [Haliovirga abyssi]BDU50333.1 hypothetical protein HLVA_09020 [Haliovirga abyssi]
MKSIKHIIFIILLMINSIVMLAATPSITLDIDTIQIPIGETANLSVALNNMKGAKALSINGLNNFKVVSKSSSTQTTIINFKKTESVNYNYTILATQKGEYPLKATVKYKGKIYESNILNISVTKASQQTGFAKNIFLKTVISKDKIYFGEKLILAYDLYTRYNVNSYGFTDKMNLDKFMVKTTDQDKLKGSYVYINGKKYVKKRVYESILTPLNSGEIKIPSFAFQANIATNDDFGFFNTTKPKILMTKEKIVNVLKLPLDGQPKNFTGIIGNLNIESNILSKNINYGDSTTLTIKLFGDCNLDNVDKIIKSNIKGFKIYESLKKSSEDFENGKYLAKKQFDIIIIPEKTGELVFPGIEIPYFNPTSGKYEIAKVKSFKIKVTGTMKQNNIANSYNNNQEELNISTLPVNNVITKEGNNNYFVIKINKILAYIIIVVIFVLLILLIVIIILNRTKDNINSKMRKCKTVDEVYDLFADVLKDKYAINIKAFSMKSLKEKINDEDIIKIISKFNNKEYEEVNEIKKDIKIILKKI